MTSMQIVVEDLLNKETVVQLGLPPNRIDILTDLETLDFESCFAQREITNLDGLEMAFIDFESLIKAKLAAGRPQDKVDAKKLKDQKKKKK